MRKFKLFMASVLTYFMAMSILPTTLLQTVANAAENQYSVLVKSDYYLKGNAQYSDESLIVYEKSTTGETQISIVKNGKETLLKEVKGDSTVQVYSNGDYKSGIAYLQLENDKYYENFEEFNFKTREFKKITEEEFKSTYMNEGTNGEVKNKIWTDTEIEEILKKISKNFDVNLTISDKTLEPVNDYYSEYINENERLSIDLDYANNNENIIEFYLSYSNKKLDKSERRYGIIYGDYVYIGREGLLSKPNYQVDNENIYIFADAEDNVSGEITKANKKGMISKKKIRVSNYNAYFEISEDCVYIRYPGHWGQRPTLSIYKENKESYEYIETITYLPIINNLSRNGRLMLQKTDDKLSLINLNGAVIEEIYDFSNSIDVDTITMDAFGTGTEDNFILNLGKDTIILQKATSETLNPQEPTKPETPKPQEPVTPSNPGNDGSTKPSEEKVVTEVTKINPNEKNEIPVKTTEGTKNIEVVIKDIEAIKNGTGSLNIASDNGVIINLPLSLIDKSLLEGSKNVTIKLDILENSDITKNVKGVNKVFDFNLIINKEDGTTSVHNFKDGLAEVKLTLTDKDLEGLNKEKIVAYYYNDSTKKFEAMETSVNGNEVTFKTPHFSKYVVAEKMEVKNEEVASNEGSNGTNGSNGTTVSKNNIENKTETGKGQLPETGARVSSTTILVLAVGMLAIGGAMFFRKRRHA